MADAIGSRLSQMRRVHSTSFISSMRNPSVVGDSVEERRFQRRVNQAFSITRPWKGRSFTVAKRKNPKRGAFVVSHVSQVRRDPSAPLRAGYGHPQFVDFRRDQKQGVLRRTNGRRFRSGWNAALVRVGSLYRSRSIWRRGCRRRRRRGWLPRIPRM
jgi:hypothetical protein